MKTVDSVARGLRFVTDNVARVARAWAHNTVNNPVYIASGREGVIIEVEIACVEAFNLRKSVTVVRRDWVTRHLD